MNDNWYVAEPDGSTIGPMTRDAVVNAATRHAFSSEAVVWHVDVGEWQPLSRILLRFGRSSTPKAPSATSTTQLTKAQVRDERQKQRDLPVSQRTDSKTDQAAADRKRRVAEPARVKLPPKLPDPAVATKAAAEESGRKLGIAGKRLMARYFDVMSIGMFVAVLVVTLRARSNAGVEAAADSVPDISLLLWIAFAAMVVLDSVLLATFGTTPGKALLGLSVSKRDGSKLEFGESMQRAVTVFARGCALGIPFLAPFAMIVAAVQTLSADGDAPWDKAQGLRVDSKDVSSGAWKAIIIGAIVLWVAMTNGWWLLLVHDVLQ